MADRIDAKCECGAALLDAGAPIGTYCERGKECPRFRAALAGKADRIDGDLVAQLETAADRYAVCDAGWNETKDIFRSILAEAERRGADKAKPSDVLRLPAHKASLTISHNDHKSIYESVQSYCEFRDMDDDDWVSVEERDKAYATQESCGSASGIQKRRSASAC